MSSTTNDYSYEAIEQSLSEDLYVKIGLFDIDGVLRGKIYSKQKFLSVLKQGGTGMSSAVFGWDISDTLYTMSSKYCNPGGGFGDFLVQIDPTTMRRITYENNIPLFLTYTRLSKNEVLPVCPRQFLRTLLDKVKDDGYEVFSGIELEWYNFKGTKEVVDKKPSSLQYVFDKLRSYSFAKLGEYSTYTDDIYRHCNKMGINIECLHTETGPGAFEVALKYTEAFNMAEQSQLFKSILKHISHKHSIVPTFMAKPSKKYTGSAAHIHISLKDNKGRNIFQPHNSDRKYSIELEYFMAGLIKCIPCLMPILCPNINSYKRLVENCWAPTKLSWGIENRLTALRVICAPTCEEEATHIEIRIPGSDVNCYLALAACIAAGYHGIQNKLELTQEPAHKDSEIEDHQGEYLSKNLKDATLKMMEPESVARHILGNDFIDHYGMTRLHECKQFESEVTDYEINRYFELT